MPEICKENHGQFNELAQRFHKTEQLLEAYKVEDFEFLVPAVNQLRYVGHHLVKALESDTQVATQAQELNEGFIHCQRAEHDACEALLWHHAAHLVKGWDEYKKNPYAALVIDDFRARMARDKQLVHRANQSRQNGNENRAHKLAEMSAILDEIKASCDELESWEKSIAALTTESQRLDAVFHEVQHLIEQYRQNAHINDAIKDFDRLERDHQALSGARDKLRDPEEMRPRDRIDELPRLIEQFQQQRDILRAAQPRVIAITQAAKQKERLTLYGILVALLGILASLWIKWIFL